MSRRSGPLPDAGDDEPAPPTDIALDRLRLDEHIDLEAALRQVVDDVTSQLDADRGTLYLVDRARGELVSRMAHLPELSEIRLSIGEGVAGWVAQTGRPVNVPNGPHDDRFNPRIDELTGYQTRSLLAVPVLRPGAEGAVGVLQVLNKRGRDGSFDGADLRHLELLARGVAHVLESTSLGAQLGRQSDRALEFHFNHIVGESPEMRAVFRRTARAACTDVTVVVRGESGTGKEAIARALHVNSPRSAAPFVTVDCAALPAQLIENELFGHERGAFTGAERRVDGKVRAADGGTLFLDEVGELPTEVQGKLLRLLQERTYLRVGGTEPVSVDLRFVCATNRDLEAEVAAGRFRQDLYYRLRVVEIAVPPLRLRGGADLDRLTDHFLWTCARRHDRPQPTITAAARAALHAHDWPGNVRELLHCIESAVVLSHEMIDTDALSIAPPPPAGPRFTTDIEALRDVERAYVRHVLAWCDGNRSAAARLLGIGRNTLLRKLSS